MRLLILGGTQFVGRHITEQALQRGHEVTVFHRGKTGVGLFPQIEHLHGDREKSALQALQGRRWEAVIDTSGYVPRLVRESAQLLAEAVERYVFISTISVYADFQHPHDESGPLAVLEDPTTEQVTGATYGGLKALCEKAAAECLPNRVLTIRPGLIVGPYDPTDRFSYWVNRVAQGGQVLAPVGPELPIQFIAAADLARWTLDQVEKKASGMYNATGLTLSMGEFLTTCQHTLASPAAFVWVKEALLLENNIAPFSELPLWVPAEMSAFARINIQKALAAGLSFRPLAETIQSTWDWLQTRPADHPWRAGLTAEKEQSLLAAL
jgi:2'-hydroxyisoflavone reductase